MSAVLLAALLAASPAPPLEFDGRRVFELDARLPQLVVALMQEENQTLLYDACEAEVVETKAQSLSIYPLPARLVRRTSLRLNALLKDIDISALEQVEVDERHVRIRATLAETQTDMDGFQAWIDLTSLPDGRTHVDARLKFELHDVGGMMDRVIARVGLMRIERGLRQLADAAHASAATR